MKLLYYLSCQLSLVIRCLSHINDRVHLSHGVLCHQSTIPDMWKREESSWVYECKQNYFVFIISLFNVNKLVFVVIVNLLYADIA